MTPIKIKDANFILRAPEGMENCEDLYASQTEDGYILSRWKPTQEEIFLLADGGSVELWVMGPHPVVALLAVSREDTHE